MKLFIDDERFPPAPESDWTIARTSHEAMIQCSTMGMPDFISFDHDIGVDDTSMVFIHWLAEKLGDGKLTFPEGFDFYVHSQNPVGAENIRCYMNNLIKVFG